MNSHDKSDHWRTSLDSVEALRTRLQQIREAHEDPVARQLMAQVAHAKSSTFMALLDAHGHVLDVNPAALIAGGFDLSEAAGLPLWTTPWWQNANPDDLRMIHQAI